MKLVSFKNTKNESRIGWLQGDRVVDMQLASEKLPTDMLTFIDGHEGYFEIIKALGEVEPHYSLAEVQLLAPLPNPRSIRDYVGFEMHMLNASRSFGHSVGEAWYDLPIFYFTNHHNVFGPNDDIKKPVNETKLDIELEMACIIGKKGSDIKKEEAKDYIFGYTIFNDWTARALQRVEMTIPLGPHKGKDFANAFGPCIVTADEFEQYEVPFSENFFESPLKVPSVKDTRFDVKMTSRINGETICVGNYKTVHFSFSQMLERASENGVNIMPGDILGSGTVGWGSLTENNFTVHRPLEPGDMVELEIEGIGVLRNQVV
ncbi:FAA hydrolase family protein [Lacihabitans sp. LS3-19]|uniref:fumarylacetoacetate hydrolase family protein n=1 Tax=Lacihabitans sp. LS3-19 TaxID=2487335 RepID=UPI0020CD346C|nr:fumarylacetoacetate hydrolase family protein [Lacihabitans sp. LS3-19]MCP9770446.1 FAA hydrolase family protein [Lacihabitans sp. LS3-19]